MPDSKPEGASIAAQRGHEASEFDAGYLGWFGIGIAALVVVTALVAFLMIGGFRVPRPPEAAAAPADAPSAAVPPALQSAPAGELRAYRRDMAAALQGYRWVDRGAGVVQMPIERAMDLIVERGARR